MKRRSTSLRSALVTVAACALTVGCADPEDAAIRNHNWAIEKLTLTGPYAGKSWVPFDSELWKQPSGSDAGLVRYLMCRDFLEKHELRGMSLAEVEALLGPAQPRLGDPGAVLYALGPEPRNNPFDAAVLVLELQGTEVVGYRLRID